MKISIIIPAFNEENTIIEILERVNNQNNKDKDYELVRNNCS